MIADARDFDSKFDVLVIGAGPGELRQHAPRANRARELGSSMIIPWPADRFGAVGRNMRRRQRQASGTRD